MRIYSPAEGGRRRDSSPRRNERHEGPRIFGQVGVPGTHCPQNKFLRQLRALVHRAVGLPLLENSGLAETTE